MLKAEAGGKWLFFVTNYVYPLCSAYYLGMIFSTRESIALSESNIEIKYCNIRKAKKKWCFWSFFDTAVDTRRVFKYTSKLMLAA